MILDKINKLIKKDMYLLNNTIKKNLKSNISLINNIVEYIITKGGGKRIRPIIAILSAKSLNYKGIKHIIVASFIEFIHAATLLHDDVIDNSKYRRGKPTSNLVFGNAESVLIGDFIYTRAFQMITNLGSMKILKIMSKSANKITEGEILQLMNLNNINFSEQEYMKIIYNKTAKLFEVAAQSAAIITKTNIKKEIALKNYGKHIGIAYQIIDDLLDYNIDNNKLGKKIGKDFFEGKVTLPFIHAIKNINIQQSNIIKKSIINKNQNELFFKNIIDAMKKCGSIEWTQKIAQREAEKAIICLKEIDNSVWKDALKTLANLLVYRNF